MTKDIIELSADMEDVHILSVALMVVCMVSVPLDPVSAGNSVYTSVLSLRCNAALVFYV